MVSTQEIREIQKKLGALDPSWKEQEDTEGVPENTAEGVDLSDAIKANLMVSLREQLHRKSARIGIESVSEGDDISIDLNDEGAIQYTVQSSDTPEDVVNELRDLLNDDSDLSAIATAEARSEDYADLPTDHLLLRGEGTSNYTLDVETTGSQTVEVLQDAHSAQVRIFLLTGGSSHPSRWALGNGTEFTVSSWRGLTERFIVSGYSRAFVEVYSAEADGSHSQDVETHAFMGPAL